MGAQWVMIPVVAFECLSGNKALVYGAIFGLSGKKGYCYAGAPYIARMLNISANSVRRIIQELQEGPEPCVRVIERQGRPSHIFPLLGVDSETPTKLGRVSSDPDQNGKAPSPRSVGTPTRTGDDLEKDKKKDLQRTPSPVVSGGIASGKCNTCTHTDCQLMTAVYQPHKCPVKGCGGTVLPVEVVA